MTAAAPPLDLASAAPPREDYWELTKCEGIVVSNDALDKLDRHIRGARVLVKLDVDVRKLGLHCHNPVENALYLFSRRLGKTG